MSPDTVTEFMRTIAHDNEIMEQLAFIRQWGGKFVVPIPQIRIYA